MNEINLSPQFNTALRGYKRDDIDQLLNRIRQALTYPGAPGNISGREISQAQFKVVRRGYDRTEVDAFLAEAVQQLEPVSAGAENIEVPPAPRPKSLFFQARGERFPRKKFDRGYNVEEVDHLVEEFESTLDTSLTSQRAHSAVLNNAWRGYETASVDEWLDQVTAYLSAQGR